MRGVATRPSMCLSLLLVAILFPARGFARFGHQATPEPSVLLRAIANARLQMPPFSVTLQIVGRNRIGGASRTYEVLSSEQRRRFWQVDENSARTRSIFDGKQIIYFDGKDSVNLRDVSNPMGDYLFNPRILGVTTIYFPDHTVEYCLGLTQAGDILLVGDDKVDGLPVWHCRVDDPRGYQFDYWIQKSDELQVLRSIFTSESSRRVTESKYTNPSFLPLPTVAETRRFANDEEIAFTQITVVEMQKDITIPEETWTLAGLDLPIGTPVADIEKHVRVGYWDGQGLSEFPPTPQQVVAMQEELEEPGPSRSIWQWVLTANVILVGVLLALVAMRQWNRAA